MIFWDVKLYIINKAKKEKVILNPNYEFLLEEYKMIDKPSSDKIVFSWFYNQSDFLNASARLKNFIILNSRWAYQIVKDNNEQTRNAFCITIGHELTHKEGDICKSKYGIGARRFICWVNEVHCDFGGAQKMADSDREKLLMSCEYKQDIKKSNIKVKKFNKKTKKSDEDAESHPDWEKRINYVKEYDFNEKLIKKIAEDVNFHDEEIIQRVCHEYDDIYLYPSLPKAT